MKKLLLLSMAALACWGCSKNTVQGELPAIVEQDAKIITGTRTEPLEVVFYYQMSPTPGFTIRSSVEYRDEYGVIQTLDLDTRTHTYYIRVAKDGYITINFVMAYRYDVVYASISTDVYKKDTEYEDHIDVFRRCIRGDTPLMGAYTIPASLFNSEDTNIPDEITPINIFLRGDENEENVLPEVGGCYDSN